MKKKVFNANYVEVMGKVIENEGKGFTREIVRLMPNRTPNSVIATLAAMNKAGYLDNSKNIFEGKMLTHYVLNELGTVAYNTATSPVEVADEAPEADANIEAE